MAQIFSQVPLIVLRNLRIKSAESAGNKKLTTKAGYMKKIIFLLLTITSLRSFSQTPLQKFEFVDFSKVNITDNFWKPKIDKVATVTMKACIYQTEIKTPRIRNFEKVQGTREKNLKDFITTTVMCTKLLKLWPMH